MNMYSYKRYLQDGGELEWEGAWYKITRDVCDCKHGVYAIMRKERYLLVREIRP